VICIDAKLVSELTVLDEIISLENILFGRSKFIINSTNADKGTIMSRRNTYKWALFGGAVGR
jgi:hypothetical protein